MAFTKSIRSNILSNTTGYAVTALVALVMTPFIVTQLGTVAYGLWILIVSLTGYYGLMDVGVRGAVSQYVTRYWTQNDMSSVNKTLSSAVIMLSGIALLILGISVLAAEFAPTYLQDSGHGTSDQQSINPQMVQDSYWVILITGLSAALALPLSAFGTATFARRRFDISNGIVIGERLLSAGLLYYVLTEGHGLLGLAIVNASTITLANIVRVVLAYQLLPGLHIKLRSFSTAACKELSKFGVASFLASVADRLIYTTDVVIIGFALPVTTAIAATYVTHYELSSKLIPYFLQMINAVVWTLTPYAIACDARGDRPALQRLWLKGSRGMFLLTGLIAGGLMFMGRDFLSLWAPAGHASGEGIIPGETLMSGTSILVLLALATLLRTNMAVGRQILFGMREVNIVAKVSLAEAICNLLLSLILIRYYGLFGVILGTLIPTVVFQLWILPHFLMRRLSVSFWQTYAIVPRGGLTLMVCMGICFYALDPWMPAANWGFFLLKCAAIAIPAIFIGLWVGTSKEERADFRNQLLRKSS